MRQGSRHLHKEQGLVLLAALLFLLVNTLAATWMFEMQVTQRKREKEEQLMFVGGQFKRAIASYASMRPQGAPSSLPQSLEDLLNDHRFPEPVHHLRQIYVDPMTGRADWRLIRTAAGVLGVASTSTEAALKLLPGTNQVETTESRGTYATWIFAVELNQTRLEN